MSTMSSICPCAPRQRIIPLPAVQQDYLNPPYAVVGARLFSSPSSLQDSDDTPPSSPDNSVRVAAALTKGITFHLDQTGARVVPPNTAASTSLAASPGHAKLILNVMIGFTSVRLVVSNPQGVSVDDVVRKLGEDGRVCQAVHSGAPGGSLQLCLGEFLAVARVTHGYGNQFTVVFDYYPLN